MTDLTDLTALTTPYGLLDEGTREALKAHGGPYQSYTGFDWRGCETPTWATAIVFRVKPQPPQPREWWLCCGRIYQMEHHALDFVRMHPGEEIIHVREVLP